MSIEGLPAVAQGSLFHELSSIIEPIDLAALFPVRQPLEIELGCGDGSFLANYARMHSARNFIGVERLLGRLRKSERKARRAGLTNVRVVRIESGYFLEYLLPPRTAEVLHIYFPDPWPKRKHRRHRLISERFPGIAKRALVPGGTVYLRTDNQEYYQQMLAVFEVARGFRTVETPAELSTVLTDFERGFQERGLQTLRVAYRVA